MKDNSKILEQKMKIRTDKIIEENKFSGAARPNSHLDTKGRRIPNKPVKLENLAISDDDTDYDIDDES